MKATPRDRFPRRHLFATAARLAAAPCMRVGVLSSSPRPIGSRSRSASPGPLAARILLSPVAAVLLLLHRHLLGDRKSNHPLNYFFFGCAFFAFHLLFSYLVDHLSIAPAFSISAAVSVVLIVTYARLFTGWTFALREMGISQLLYLVLFSLTFLWTGFTGLAITVGAVLSLFVMMQLTGPRAGRSRCSHAPRASPPPLRGRGVAAPPRGAAADRAPQRFMPSATRAARRPVEEPRPTSGQRDDASPERRFTHTGTGRGARSRTAPTPAGRVQRGRAALPGSGFCPRAAGRRRDERRADDKRGLSGLSRGAPTSTRAAAPSSAVSPPAARAPWE